MSDFAWAEVKNHRLDPAFVPVLIYMRDVEPFTDIYYREVLRTPTGKDPVLRRSMERWVVEEADHGEVLNHFLGEAGAPIEEKWQLKAKAAIPSSYTIGNYIATSITNLFGKSSTGTHMVWGAINEMTTRQGYRRLGHAARHPLLSRLLRAIVREESAHANFYFQIARLRLMRSKFAQGLARFAVDRFLDTRRTRNKGVRRNRLPNRYVVLGATRRVPFRIAVSKRIVRLPGFEGVKTITDRVSQISLTEICRK